MLTAILALGAGCIGLLTGALLCAWRHAEDEARLELIAEALRHAEAALTPVAQEPGAFATAVREEALPLIRTALQDLGGELA